MFRGLCGVFISVFMVMLLSACTTTTMSDAERDALMAECQLIDDDTERAECLERLVLGGEAEPVEQVDPVQF